MEPEDLENSREHVNNKATNILPNNSSDLARFLSETRELPTRLCKVLQDNNVDGETFLNLNRCDLLDLYKFDFKARKEVADCVEFLKMNEFQVKDEDDQLTNDLSSSTASTMSVNSSLEDDDTEINIIPPSQQQSVIPKLKRTHAIKINSCQQKKKTKQAVTPLTSSPMMDCHKRKKKQATCTSSQEDIDGSSCSNDDKDFTEVYPPTPQNPVSKKKNMPLSSSSEVLKEFKFPIAPKVRKYAIERKPLEDEDRRHLIRECVTCLKAQVGETITKPQFQYASKAICDQVPVLKDEKPPNWQSDMEFPFWGSVEYLMKKRYLNIKSRSMSPGHQTVKRKRIAPAEEKDIEVLHKELLKTLKPALSDKGKKKYATINWEDVKKLQGLTFERRKNDIQGLSGHEVIHQGLERYPFLEIEECLWNELELHLSSERTIQDFRERWKNIAPCFVDDKDLVDEDDICVAALESMHKKFDVSEPIVSFMDEGSDLEDYLKTLKSKDPQLIAYMYDANDGNKPAGDRQVFVVIDKDILLECGTNGVDSLITLLSVYYTFNLSYTKTQSEMFRFLEEHVLGKATKRKSYLYKKRENSILAVLKNI